MRGTIISPFGGRIQVYVSMINATFPHSHPHFTLPERPDNIHTFFLSPHVVRYIRLLGVFLTCF